MKRRRKVVVIMILLLLLVVVVLLLLLPPPPLQRRRPLLPVRIMFPPYGCPMRKAPPSAPVACSHYDPPRMSITVGTVDIW